MAFISGEHRSNRPAQVKKKAQRPQRHEVMGHPVLRCQVNMGLPLGEAAEYHHTPLPA